MASCSTVVGDYDVFRGDDDELGSGTFGTVTRGRCRSSGVDVAVKRFKLGDERTPEGREWNSKYIEGEIKLLQEIDHQNVIKLYHSEKVKTFMYLFLELCREGNLNEFVKKVPDLPPEAYTEVTPVSFMRDITDALVCLHGQSTPIIHRDVKLDNLLVTKDAANRYIVKITDFGISRRILGTGDAMTLTMCGPPRWMAPEVLPDINGHVKYNIQCDTYSAGLVFLTLLDNQPGEPLVVLEVCGKSVGIWMNERLKQQKPAPLPDIIRENDAPYKIMLKKLIAHMICAEPSERYTMKHVSESLDMCEVSLRAEIAARKEREELICKTAQVERERNEMKRQTTEAKAERARLKTKTTQVERERANLQQRIVQNESEKRRMMLQIEAERDKLKQNNAQVITERKRLEENTTQVIAERAQLKEELAQTKTEQAEWREKTAQNEAELTELKVKIAQAKNERAKLKVKVTQSEKEQTKLKLKIAQAEKKAVSLSMSEDQLPREVAILRYSYTRDTKETVIAEVERYVGRIVDKCFGKYPVKPKELKPYSKCQVTAGYPDAIVFTFDSCQDALALYIEAKQCIYLSSKVLLLQPEPKHAPAL